MPEATPTERRQARMLFEQLIQRSLSLQVTPETLASKLWPFVSADDETLLDVTVLVTALRDGAASKQLTRQEIVDKCETILQRIRSNPKDNG